MKKWIYFALGNALISASLFAAIWGILEISGVRLRVCPKAEEKKQGLAVGEVIYPDCPKCRLLLEYWDYVGVVFLNDVDGSLVKIADDHEHWSEYVVRAYDAYNARLQDSRKTEAYRVELSEEDIERATVILAREGNRLSVIFNVDPPTTDPPPPGADFKVAVDFDRETGEIVDMFVD